MTESTDAVADDRDEQFDDTDSDRESEADAEVKMDSGAEDESGVEVETGSEPTNGTSGGYDPARTNTNTQFCMNCGEEISEQAAVCTNCGVAVNSSADSNSVEKNPGLAALASAVITGGGQIYNGELAKGILLMVVQVINVILMFVLIGLITFPITWVYSVWDAYKTAERMNEEGVNA
ncbi:zinc ribbon domain-containing protein [Natrinema caseinilyticum]|uniref:zinc ribbon domain-containing protein n=1 Tax=Natrinema caseinilyticum TaxID=2961570 RepID=UPI0020C52B43|nr:zinc-ribbon domain-containing protein [Natrinema caseinilyticum]